jgi:hypothetical protein
MDAWDDEAAKAQGEAKRRALLESALVYSVFSTPQGQKLMEKWTDILLLTPGAQPGMDLLEIGIIEGQKAFVRSIKNAIKQHET